MSMRYGFIGLGNLGKHLSRNLLKAGFTVAVHDKSKGAASQCLSLGAVWAETPADAARDVDGLITCLPSPTASAAVMTGEGEISGALDTMATGSTWIEMSTNDEKDIKRIAAIAEKRGIHTLEAPVTGGVHRAAAGQITVLAGGNRDVFSRHRPALAAMGGEVIYMGPLGHASIIKVITNMLAFIHLIGVGEALMLAKRGGLDLATSFAAIKASSGNSFVHETESQVILNGSYNIGFTMDLACKDAGLAMDMGQAFGVPLRLASAMEQIFIEARQVYGGSAWSPQVVKLLEDALGEPLRADGFPAELGPDD